jgi:hypothetical protein
MIIFTGFIFILAAIGVLWKSTVPALIVACMVVMGIFQTTDGLTKLAHNSDIWTLLFHDANGFFNFGIGVFLLSLFMRVAGWLVERK